MPSDLMIVLVSLVFSAFFSGVETAFICTNHLSVKKRSEPAARQIEQIFTLPEHFLTVTLVGNNICNIAASGFFTSFLIGLGVGSPEFLVTVILTPVVLVFGEVLPKTTARIYQERFLLRVWPLFRVIEWILMPLTFLIEKLSMLIRSLFKKDGPTWSRDDIKILIATLHSHGELELSEKEAIEDVFDFARDRVKDIVTPMNKIVAFDYADELDSMLAVAREFGFTRYPIFRNRRITGYINIFDVFYHEFNDWRELIRPITRVGANQKLDEVFTVLKRKRESIALVHKGKRRLGIVTLQDLMKEITESIIK